LIPAFSTALLAAASYLRRAGHGDVVNLPGGMIAWFAADLPTET
jgi:rhodanese-related sulfurtransferase